MEEKKKSNRGRPRKSLKDIEKRIKNIIRLEVLPEEPPDWLI